MGIRAKSIVDVSSTIILVAAVVAAAWRLSHLMRADTPPRRPELVEAIQDVSMAASRVRHVRGTGRVVLVEFSDYECRYCARHTATAAIRIKRELIDSGRVQHAFLNFPLPGHSHASRAAEAAECAAEQGRFWEMHEHLFENSAELQEAHLARAAETIGLNTERFRRCLVSGEMADRVRRDRKEGQRLGVEATPAFFVGTRHDDGTITFRTRIRGALPFEIFDDVLKEALAAAPL